MKFISKLSFAFTAKQSNNSDITFFINVSIPLYIRDSKISTDNDKFYDVESIRFISHEQKTWERIHFSNNNEFIIFLKSNKNKIISISKG